MSSPYWSNGTAGRTATLRKGSGPTSEKPNSSHSARWQDGRELVEELRRQNEYLRGQLDEANIRDREQRRIIAGLTQRIPAIEAPQDAREAPERAEAGVDEGGVPPEPQAGVRRPWWRRVFGG